MKTKLLVASRDNTIQEELYNTMLSKDLGTNEKYDFEFFYTGANRQPIFKEDGNGNVEYVYMKNTNGDIIIPNINDLSSQSISNYYNVVVGENDTKFKDKISEYHNTISLLGKSQYIIPTKPYLKAIGGESGPVQRIKDYLNENMCSIVTTPGKVDMLATMQENITKSKGTAAKDDTATDLFVKGGKYADVAKVYWGTGDVDAMRLNVPDHNSKSYDDLGTDKQWFIDSSGNFDESIDSKDITAIFNKMNS